MGNARMNVELKLLALKVKPLKIKTIHLDSTRVTDEGCEYLFSVYTYNGMCKQVSLFYNKSTGAFT